MKYNLVRPCPRCPFRSDIEPYLRPDRVREIEASLVNGSFFCHETTDSNRFDGGDDGNGSYYNPSGNEEHCAGALILLESLGRPSQMMRIAERLRNRDGSPMYDARKLDRTALVYESFGQMARAQVRRKTRRTRNEDV